MTRTISVILGLTVSALLASMLVFLLFRRGGIDDWIPWALIALGGVAVIAVAMVSVFRRSSRAGSPEAVAKSRSSAIWAIIAAISAQIPFLGGWVEKTSKSPDAPLIWISVGAFAIVAAVAVIMITRKRMPAAPGQVKAPWVLIVSLGLLAAGVAGTVLAVFLTPKGSIPAPVSVISYIALAVLLIVGVFVLKLYTVGMRFSSYALPDNLPAPSPPTDRRFSRGGYYDGTKLLKQHVWGMPVPVMGRGYFIRGSGKAWLADEVLAFHLYLTRNPLVIPYGIIHSVSTKNLILVKNRLPGPGMSIVWGRPDMPMVTTIQVTRSRAENEAWAQEIVRRAAVWKEKLNAAQP